MNKRTVFATILFILIIYMVSAATHAETKFVNNETNGTNGTNGTNETNETNEAIENNTNINDTSRLVGVLDDTNEKLPGPVSIPLEKPPFID